MNELSHVLLNDLDLRILGNKDIFEKSKNRLQPTPSPFSRNRHLAVALEN